MAIHEKFIEERIPGWLTHASPARRQALRRVAVKIPEWSRNAAAAAHAELAQAVKARWSSQAKVDRLFERLSDVRRFADPLLRQALKNRFGVEVDVNRTYLRLYLPTGIAVGYQTKTLSLLDAALHNFESKESGAHYFDSASCFIDEPSTLGHFNVLAINDRISVSAFVSLCRELDIGGQYAQQLETLLLPTDALAKAVLASKVKTSQQDAFRAAVLLARMKGDIGSDCQASLLQLLDDSGSGPTQCCQLQILEARLTGIMVLAGDFERASTVMPLVVYIPDDPQHPVKEYPSTLAFKSALTERLRSTDYQRFFARFVAHEHRGSFFAALDQHLHVVMWHPPQPGDPRPAWRRARVDNPALRFDMHRIQGDPWQWLYQESLNKILNDARAIAVPTADADRKSRWALWDSIVNVASIVLQVASLVAMPFVPLMGELMLAYATYQLLDETFTGILDWAEGQVSEAADHLLAIAENLAQLATFGAAGAVAGKMLAIKPSGFVEGLKPVALHDGRTRLWNPDLQPYETPLSPPSEGAQDALGLRLHAGKTVLTLENRTYEVAANPESGAYHVRHPKRPNAYRPRLTHNGAGAWAHEVERPMEWQGAQLFRRLGHSVAEFSDETARRILAASGVDDAMLRHVHVHARRPPALLEDTIRRFKLDQRIQVFREQMLSPDPGVYAKADVQLQKHLLQMQQVNLPEVRLRAGQLMETLWDVLGEREQKQLLGLSPAPGDALPARHVRTALLRGRMARWAEENRGPLFRVLEESFESAASAETQQMRRTFPGLPRTVAEELWREASAAERLLLHNSPGMPRRMAQEALFYLRELRLTRAYEGLYLQAVSSADSDKLALHMLETLEGWKADIRLEVREGHFEGALLDSVGPIDAPIRKVLVRQQNQYETFDEHGLHLHGRDELFAAIQRALPQAQREALGLPHVGQVRELEQKLRQQALLPRPELRELFGQPPLEPRARSPMGLAVRRSGYLLGGGDLEPPEARPLAQRFRALFPTLSEEDLAALRHERLTGDPSLAMAHLEIEYLSLVNDLELWVKDVPSRHPVTGALLDAGTVEEQRFNRQAFMEELKASWSHKQTLASPYEPHHFYLYLDVMGTLPELSASFGHVTELVLGSRTQPLRGHGFLKSFTGLQFLTLEGVNLGTFPEEIYQMRSLQSLTLNDCAVQLTDATAEGLSRIESLKLLSLNDNPLGQSPHVGFMKELRDLYLRNTQLTEVPSGLSDLECLSRVDLTFNAIVELPEELFEVPDTRDVDFNLSGNPLSLVSLRQIGAYLDGAGLDRKVSIRFDGLNPDVEVVESDSEGPSSDSALGSDEGSDEELD